MNDHPKDLDAAIAEKVTQLPPAPTVNIEQMAFDKLTQLVKDASKQGRKEITEARDLLDDLLRAIDDRGNKIVDEATKYIGDVESTIRAKDAIMEPFKALMIEMKVQPRTHTNEKN